MMMMTDSVIEQNGQVSVHCIVLYCIVMNLKMHNFGNEIDNPRTKK